MTTPDDTPQWPEYPEDQDTAHDDQLSPVASTYQVKPDGEIVNVNPGPPPSDEVMTETLEMNEDGSVSVVQRPGLPPDFQPGAPADLTDTEADAIRKAAQLERERLAEPPANVINNAPHFLRNVDGEEVCGQCGEPWECPSYRQISEQNAAQLSGVADGPPTQPFVPPTMEEAAAAAGVDMQEFMARLTQVRRQ